MDRRCFTLLLSFLATAVKGQEESYDYCDPELKLCEVSTDHTMCKYPVPGLSPQCTPNVNEPLNANEKDRILFLHNTIRSYVAEGVEKNRDGKLPPAANMRQLYWDEELESIAERWADQCTRTTNRPTYDKCRNTKRFQVSQNVGTRRVNGSNIVKQAAQIVITWYKETKHFDPALVDRFVENEGMETTVKQFANLIWADTYAVGCARVIFQEQLPSSDKNAGASPSMTERLVCNYGPGGSEPGKPTYKRGAPCEGCPAGTRCSQTLPGLCAKVGISINKSPPTGITLRNVIPGTEETKVQPKVEVTEGGSYLETKTSAGFTTEGLGEKEVPKKEKCFGGNCPSAKTSNVSYGVRLSEAVTSPTSKARKKSLEFGFDVPSHGNDFVTEKGKWILSNGRVRRSDSEDLKNGDSCNCYVTSEGSSAKSSAFPLLFSAFIILECFLIHTGK